MKEDLLEIWLERYGYAKYNLGESGVAALGVKELLDLTDGWEELGKLTLENNPTYGSEALRSAVAELYSPAVGPENVLITAGVTEAILIYYHSRFRPGANVVVPSPVFHVLRDVAQEIGFEVRVLPLRREDSYLPRLDALRELVDDRTATIVMNTPHNPSGAVLSAAQGREIIELAKRHGSDVLFDEHYRVMPHEQPWAPLPSFAGYDDSVVALGSVGKCLGSVGLRIGWIIAGPDRLEPCHQFKDLTTHTVCSINDYLALKSLQVRELLGARYQAQVLGNLFKLAGVIERQSLLGWTPPKAGTTAFPFLTVPGMSSIEFARRLVERTEVLVLPGEAFDQPGHFRVNLGQRPEIFGCALDRLENFVGSWA